MVSVGVVERTFPTMRAGVSSFLFGKYEWETHGHLGAADNQRLNRPFLGPFYLPARLRGSYSNMATPRGVCRMGMLTMIWPTLCSAERALTLVTV